MPKRTRINQPRANAENRRRVYAACHECRRRRRKCNGNQPCTQCQAYGYACTYEAGDASVQLLDASNTSSQTETVRRRQLHLAPDSPAAEDTAALPNLIVSRERGRFVNANSAAALPHLIGQELAMEQPLRFHSYAWNLGIRPERRGTMASSLSDYLSLPECQAFSEVYFEAVHPLFNFLNRESYLNRLTASWSTLESQPNFVAVVALVVLLGSFFSPPAAAHPREEDIKRHGISILDLAMSNAMAAIDMDSVAGWILRTLYMRLTTRPAISCMASNTAMHFSEIMGLHRDLVDNTAPTTSKSAFNQNELDSRRRYFCTARFLNQLLTTEYGISPVSPLHANCVAPVSLPGAYVHALHSMTSILRDAEASAGVGLDSEEFVDLFRRLRDIAHDHAVVSLFIADVCLCLLRRFAASSAKPSSAVMAVSAPILRRGLDGITVLLAAQRTWWNMLSVPFQSICVCASTDNLTLLALLPTAMELLRAVADKFGSHMAKEALATAQQIIAASKARTHAKLAMKDAALTHALPALDIDWGSFDSGFDITGEWPPVVDFFFHVEETLLP